MSRFVRKLRIILGRDNDFTAVRANIRGSAALLESLYLDTTRLEEMSQVGYLAWQKRFTWEKIAGEYETLYRTLVEGEV